MNAKKFFIYFLVMLVTASPAAGEVFLNRWVLNVTLHDNGNLEAIIQTEIENAGALPLEGISFIIPASKVTMIYGFSHTYSSRGQVADQQTVPGGTKITVYFNESVKAGDKWNGRIGFTAENWAVKEGSNYSIDIPVKAPLARVAGKDVKFSLPKEPEIRSQVFLPKSIEVISVKPQPFRILFQYGLMVPTWTPEKLNIGDTISIKGSFSSILNKIVETDEIIRKLSASIKEAKSQGIDVRDAETHLKNAEAYNTNQALASFWKKENAVALEYVGYANDELKLVESSLSVKAQVTEAIPTEPVKKTPFIGAAVVILVLLISCARKKR